MAPATRKSRTASKSSDQMKIFLRVNSTISVKVKPSDTFRSLKSKISRKLGIPKDSQALLDKTPLRDDKTLSECFIKNGSILDLAVLGMQIFVKVPSRTWEILELRVKELDTIQVVKSKIHEKLKIPPDKESTLTYSGIPLEDGNTLAFYKIKKESTLVLAIHQTEYLKVFLNLPSRKTITLDAKIWYSVGEVKSMIESMVNLEDPRLLYLGKNLEDSKSLADYKIKQGATIIVMHNMYIFVRTSKGKTIRLGVDSSDTIESVKEKLIEIKEGIHASKMTLLYVGRRLQDDMTLADYNIHKESVLFIVPILRGGGCGNPDTVNKVKLEPQDQSDPEGEPGSEEESDTKSDTENDEEESEAETDHESDKEESDAENDQGNDEEES